MGDFAPSNAHVGGPEADDGSSDAPQPRSGPQSTGSSQQPAADFNPFPFGAPPPDSPVAAAFPEIFPAPAQEPNPYAPPTAPPWASAAPPNAPWVPPTGPQPAQWSSQQPAQWSGQQDGGQSPTFHGSYPGQYASGQSAPGQYAPGQPAFGQYAPGQPAPTAHGQGAPPGHQFQRTAVDNNAVNNNAVNNKAIAGMVLGIVSIAFFFLTVLDIPLIVLGIVFSALGLRAARRGEGRRTMALAGLICSIVAAAVVVVAVTYVAHRSQVCENRADRGSAEYNNCMIHFN